MSQNIEPLIRDLVEWCAWETRRYDDVLEAWRTSCPRLTVWEDAVARGLLEPRAGPGGLMVVVTEAGRQYLGDRPTRRAKICQAPIPAVAMASEGAGSSRR